MDTNSPQQQSNPTPEGATTPPSADQPITAQQTTPNNPEKPTKPRGKLIATICITVVAIGGLIGGILWWLNYSKPENVVLGSILNVIKADHITETISIGIIPKDTSLVKMASIDATAIAGPIPSEFDGKLSIITENGDISLDIAVKITDNGIVYAKLDGIADIGQSLIIDLLEKGVPSFSDLSESQKEQIEDMIKVKILNELGSTLDGKWWEFDIASKTLNFPTEVTETYNCAVKELKKIRTDDATQKSLADIYQQNPFIIAKNSSSNKYEVSLSANGIQNFAKAAADTNLNKNLASCANIPTDENAENPTEGELAVKEFIDDLPTFEMQIDVWTRRLNLVSISYENDIVQVTSAIKFSYDQKTVTAPEDSSEIINLLPSLTPIFEDLNVSF